MLRSKGRALVLFPYLLSLLVLIPLHAGVLTGIDGCGDCLAFPTAMPGHADPGQEAPGGQPIQRHNESTCTICAVGGQVVVAELGQLSADSDEAGFLPTSPPCHTAPSLLAPRSPRAPPSPSV